MASLILKLVDSDILFSLHPVYVTCSIFHILFYSQVVRDGILRDCSL